MRWGILIILLVLLTGCQSGTSYSRTERIRIYNSFQDIPVPYAVIGTVKPIDHRNRVVKVSRRELQSIALNQEADAIVIARTNPNPEANVFYTAPERLPDHKSAREFVLISSPQANGAYKTVAQVREHNDLPLTVVFINYL